MSPYLKSLGTDFWYCYYFLKKLNFSTLHQQKPSKTFKNCFEKHAKFWKKKHFFEAKIRISQIRLICITMMWNGSWSVSGVPKLQFHAYMTPRNIFEKIFKNSKSATNIIFSRFMQLEAALVLEKPLFELEASNFSSFRFEAIVKPFKLGLQWVHI